MNTFQILAIVLSVIIVFLIILSLIIYRNLKSRLKQLERKIEELHAGIKNSGLKEKNSARLFDMVIDSIPHGIIILDRQSRILKINESVAALFHLDKDKVTGSRTIIIFNNKKLEDLISAALLESQRKIKEILFYGDEDLNLEVDTIPLNLNDFALLLILRNTTQEVEFSRLRSQFVANVSHEMRTPLTSIKGYLETVIENYPEDKKVIKKYLPKTLEEVERLHVLIEDLLDLSNIEYKRNLIIKQEHEIVPIINDCIDSLGFLARKNGVRIIFEYQENDIRMFTDEDIFRQMVRNMIENSIFHGGKNIELRINLQQADGKTTLAFTDNGAGIEKRDLPYIFQRFYRGRSTGVAGKAGSGLGLSIVKHITELHNGKVEISSIPGVETRFEFVFPG